MTVFELEKKLYEFIKPTYPNIKIEILNSSHDNKQLYFTDEKFSLLFPLQRYHNLIHLIPEEFFKTHLEDSEWFELAPDEEPSQLDYHNDETIESIKDIILNVITKKVPYKKHLDSKFMEDKSVQCLGDFRYSKEILEKLAFSKEEQFDIFHVLMNQGGYCDCEILYNVFSDSNYGKQYWKERNKG
jgi:hypothetical protein